MAQTWRSSFLQRVFCAVTFTLSQVDLGGGAFSQTPLEGIDLGDISNLHRISKDSIVVVTRDGFCLKVGTLRLLSTVEHDATEQLAIGGASFALCSLYIAVEASDTFTFVIAFHTNACNDSHGLENLNLILISIELQ